MSPAPGGGRSTPFARQARVTTWLVAGGLALSYAFVVRGTWFRTSLPIDPWLNADWLINYHAGPVRRGLTGEVILSLVSDVHQAVTLATLLPLALLAVVYVAGFALFLSTSRSPAWLMLVLSPAFLLFPVISAEGGLRKELLALAALSLVVLIVSRGLNPWLLVMPYVILGFGCFSHESVALSVPAFLFTLLMGQRWALIPRGHALGGAVVVATLAAAGLLFSALNPGTPEQVARICDSLESIGAPTQACAGAVAALDGSLLSAAQEVSLLFPEYFAYLPLALVALIPIAVVRPPRSFWWLVVVTYAALLPLFLTAVDYGRWIYLATALVSLPVLGLWGRRSPDEMRVPLIVAVLFVLMWSLPYTGPVVQQPLYGQLLSEPYHAVAGWLSRATGLS